MCMAEVLGNERRWDCKSKWCATSEEPSKCYNTHRIIKQSTDWIRLTFVPRHRGADYCLAGHLGSN